MQTAAPGPNEIFPGVQDPGPKRFFDGTHRLVPPEETLARLEPLKAAMGITRVANVTGLDTIGLPVVMVTRPQARSVAVNQGKGASLTAAKASGLMECVESYHAERVTGPLFLDSYEELRTRCDVVDVERLEPHPAGLFRPDLPILWIQGFDLLSHRWVHVPHETVHTDFTNRMLTWGGCFFNSSNGLASGNHLLEAICHGICEVIERDAYWRWLVAGRYLDGRDRIDPETISDAGCQELLALCRRADRRVGLWDITTVHGVATVHCMIAGPEGDESRRLYANSGTGCHAVREIALQRALTEAVQSRLTLISASRDDLPENLYQKAGDPDLVRFHLDLLDAMVFGRSFDDVPSQHFDSFAEDVRWYLKQLCSCGLRSVIVVDLTRPEIDVPVVRVIIPGTRLAKE